MTGLLFLGALFFIYCHRVLYPVVKPIDVIGRPVAQDYNVELPRYDLINEVSDTAYAARVFRDNGIGRCRL